MYENYLKPLFDKIVAVIGLIVLLPILTLVAILLMIFQNGEIIFTQNRPGKNGKIFKLVKFKTMNNDTNSCGDLLSDEERLTKIGAWIRKLSIDELPQLVNVIKGEMSIVGPRPWLVEYLPKYNEFQNRRHEVKPGITGWAQVNGRNLISWDQRFEYDVYYVDHLTFLLDLKIIFMTVWKVLASKGVSGKGRMTMDMFLGNH